MLGVDGLGRGRAARYQELPVVVDDDFITASPVAPVDSAAEIFAALDLDTDGVLAAWRSLFGTGDPHHVATLLGEVGIDAG